MPQAFAPDEELRLFFALPLAPELRDAVVGVQQRLAQARPRVKWVEAENLHFTLKFLGEMPGRVVPALVEVGTRVAQRHRAFDLHIAGAGAFPRLSEARVVWLGCGDGGDRLETLAAGLDEALATAKLAPPESRPFRAHLTIGRSKGREAVRGVADVVGQIADAAIGAMAVDGFVLMRSRLTPSGPIYTEVDRFALSRHDSETSR